MAEENITTKFRVDISDLKKGISDANKTIKTANAEFKNATAGVDDWANSVDGLTAKIKQQETILDAEKSKLSALKTQLERLNETQEKGAVIVAELSDKYDEAVSAYGASSDEAKKYAKQLLDAQAAQERNTKAAEDLQLKILNQDTAVKNTEKSLNDYKSSLDDLKKSTDYLEQKQQDLTDAYNEAVSAYGKNSSEAKALKDELKDVSKQAKNARDASKDLGDSAEDAGDGFTVAKGAISNFISDGLTALTSSIGNAITGMAGLAEETREYRTTMASLENSSTRAGYTAEQTAETFGTLNGVLGDSQAAATTTANLQAMGLEQSKLQEITNGVIGAWATYGDSIPIDGLGEAVNHTLQLGEVQGTLADVLEWSGISVDDFNEQLGKCNTETERADLINKTLADQGLTKAGEAWQENNESIVDANNAQADYEAATAELGETIEPITADIKEGFAKIAEKVVELIQKADFSKVEKAIENGFSWFIDKGIPAIVDGFTWIIDHKDELIAGIAGIGAAFLAFKVVTLIQAVTSAMQGMTLAQAALNLVMSLNPIGLVVAAIAGLVAAFVTLWNKSEEFREFWINLWENIKTFVGNTITAIGEWFAGLWENIKNIFSVVGQWFGDIFSGAWEAIKTAWSAVIDFFVGIWEGIKKAFGYVVEFYKNLFTNAWNAIKSAFSAVSSFFTGVWTNIKNAFSGVVTWFKNIFSKAWTGIKNVFSTVGDFFGGIWDTIKSTFSAVGTKVAEAIGGAFKTAINGVISVVEGAINLVPKAINGAIGAINKLPGVEIGKLPTISLPRLAKGGIVDKSTIANIGENGAEAIIPLEKNKGGLKKIANAILGEMEQTGSKRGASAAVGSTVYNFNQTNNSPKPLNRYDIYRQSKNLLNSVKGV